MLQSDTAIISVAQRTLIPKKIPGALAVLTIPEDDIANVSDVRRLAPQLFGVPVDVTLSKEEYRRVADLIRRTDLWEAVIRDYYNLLAAPDRAEREGGDLSPEYFQEAFERQVVEPYSLNYPALARMLDFAQEADEIADSFGQHAIIGQLGSRPEPNFIGNTLFPNLAIAPAVSTNTTTANFNIVFPIL